MIVGILLNHSLNHIEGMQIACKGYLQALGRSVSIQEMRIFCVKENIKDIMPLKSIHSEKISLYEISELITHIKEGTLSILFGLDPRLANQLAEIRNFYTSSAIPVVSLIHTISFPEIKDIIRSIGNNFNASDALICTSESGRRVIKNIIDLLKSELKCFNFKAAMPIIPLGVDHKLFSPGSQKEAREKLGWPETRLIFLCTGRISNFTKMEFTAHILAFREFVKTYPGEAYLIVAGKQESESYISKLKFEARQLGLEQNIKFELDFDSRMSPYLYRGCDIFLSFSDHIQETFGLTVIEAMSTQTSVICSDWNGYKDLVQNNKEGFRITAWWGPCLDVLDSNCIHPLHSMGYLFDRYFIQSQSVAVDIHEAASRMAYLAGDASIRTKFGSSARKKVLQRFSWDVVMKKFLIQGEKLISDAGKGKMTKKPTASPFPVQKLFKHYPTKFLTEAACVQCSDLGCEYLNRQYQFIEYEQVWETFFFKRNRTRPILQLSQKSIRLDELFRKINEGEPETVVYEDIVFNVLYLLKYNLLQKVSET